MFTPELLEEIRLVLVKVRAARRLTVPEVAARMGMTKDAYAVNRVFLGSIELEEQFGARLAEALGVSWSDVIAVAKQRWDHNRLYGEAIQRLADLGAVAERSGG